MWPRKIGSESFQARRARSPRRMKAPLRVPISRATEPEAGLGMKFVADAVDRFGLTMAHLAGVERNEHVDITFTPLNGANQEF